MKKLFTLAFAVLASISLSWAETVTFTSAEIKAGTAKSGITPYFDANPTSKNLCKDGDTQNKANVCEVKNSSDTILVNSLKSQAQVLFTANGKYITKIVVNGATNSTGSGAVKNIPALYWKGTTRTDEFDGAELVTFSGYDASCENAYYTFENMPAKTQMAGIFRRVKVDNASNPTKKVNKSGKDYGDGQTFYVAEVEVTFENACSDPNASLSADPESAFVGDEVELLFSSDIAGDPNWSVKKDGVAAEAGVDYTLADARFHGLVAGEFEITATQDADGTHCAVEESVSITVSPKNPVTTVTVNGPTAAYIGNEVTLTATTDVVADTIWWTNQYGEKQESKDGVFKFTPNAAGEYTYTAWAENEFNTEPATKAHTVTVTKLCGMLIKATHTGATTATIDEASVVGGTVDKNTQSGGKLGSNGHYFGIKLASGSFQVGDVVTLVASELQGGNTATLFSDKGTNSLGSAAFDTQSLTAEITLTQSAEWIYLYRKDSGCNPVMGSISVSRSCEESNDATIHSLTVNGETVELTEGTKKYEYTVSSSYNEETVEVAFSIHPLATASLASPFTISTPAAGNTNGQAIKVTAEDGTEETYTVFITKSVSLSDNANLSALSVEGYSLTPDFDAETTAYTITKAYKAENPAESAVTATPADANAVGAVVVLEGDVFTITVTAEDNTTTKVYTITILEADAPRELKEIIFSNSYKGYLLNGTGTDIYGFYLKGEEAPTVQSCVVSEKATWAVEGTTLTVTGEDSKSTEYTIILEEVAPMTYTAEVVTLDGTESWVKGAYGFNASKGGWAFSKTDNDYSREIAGKTHVELFLPATESVLLKAGANGTERNVDIFINGVLKWSEKKLSKTDGIHVSGDDTNAFMLSVVSNQTSGDGGLGSIQLTTGHPTGMDNTEDNAKAVKMIENGQIVIIKNGVRYNVLGAELR